MKYAENTNVSSEISRLEIEKTLIRYGAEQFAYGTLPGKAIIAFAMQNRQVKIILPLPKKEDFRYTPGRRIERTEKSQYEAWEQACRQRWRALHLVIKAKLEAIEDGISTFDKEFLSDVVLPDGRTAGDFLLPQLAAAYESGKMPATLPMLEG